MYLNNKSIFKYLEVETITIMPYGVFLNNHNYKIQYGSIQNINFPSEVYVKNCNTVTIDDFYDNPPESITINYKGQKPTVENTQDIQIKFIDDN